MAGYLLMPLLGLFGMLPWSCQSIASPSFVERSIKHGASTYRYKVYVPRGWSADKSWPVVLFLHGAGERGTDNVAQTMVGLGPLLAKRDDFPFVAAMPQCPTNRWWPEPDMLELARAVLDATAKEFSGDRSRIYLTGISMGGYGAWALAATQREIFAALAPVCGGVRPPFVTSQRSPLLDFEDPYAAVASKLKAIPTWVFHGSADPIVPVTESRRLVEALRAAGASVRYSEYEGVGHSSWDRAYAEPDFFDWLLSHRSHGSEKGVNDR